MDFESKDTLADDRAHGYVMDVPYPVQHHPDLDPVRQAAAVRAAGLQPPGFEAGFRLLELGCGPGFSLAAHAAAHPHAGFVGLDINPDHVAHLRALAHDVGLTNVEAVEADFARIDPAVFAPFDFIGMHGVWSWVGEDARHALLQIVDRCLKPGGVLYLAYNCLPGMAAIAPVRDLMLLSPGAQPRLEQRIEAAVAFACRAKAAGAAYLTGSPAGARLDEIAQLPPGYLAHEYFNRDWTAFYHRDVAAALAPLGLRFCGSTRLAESMDELNFAPDALSLLEPLEGPERETLKDFFTGRTFRAEVHVRQGARPVRDGAEVRYALTFEPAPPETPPRIAAVGSPGTELEFAL